MAYGKEDGRLIIELPPSLSRHEFESIRPDGAAMVAIDPTRKLVGHGVTITTEGKGGGFINDAGQAVDYAFRYFAPWFNIYEEPACGSMQCGLAPYWAKRLGKDTPLHCKHDRNKGVS